MSKKEKTDKKAIVVKSNKLVEARYRLTLREQRLILYMISTIRSDDEDFKPYRIAVREFAGMMGLVDNGAYKAVKAITKGLIEKVLEIETPVGLLQIAWLSSALYHDKEGYVELCFDPKLKPYLLHLKECFTSYKLENVVKLDSMYSIRIYELLKQYQKIGGRTFNIEELRKILGIADNGVVVATENCR